MLTIRTRIAADARINAKQTIRSESLSSGMSCSLAKRSISDLRIGNSV